MLPRIRDQIIINHESGEMSIDLQAMIITLLTSSSPSTSPKSNLSNPKREKGFGTGFLGCLYNKDCRLFNNLKKLQN